ncbi:MAG TPA: hypothetical protein VK689_08970, partial [Armatimonadota bacterium]|nr:hypothetical protein [Armatimonadota bacterium]
MAVVRQLLFLLVVLGLATGAAFGASGPRITLRLEDATVADAAVAITRVSGVPIDAGKALPRMEPPTAPPRASFAWENASLDRVLRELCARFRCGCVGGPEGYALFSTRLPRKGPVAFEKEGVRVAVAGVARTERRATRLGPAPGPADPYHSGIAVALLADLDEARADWDARVENVAARDDRGNRLGGGLSGHPLWNTFPHQRLIMLQMPLESGQARRLTSLDGELVLSRRRAGKRFELPYPAPGRVSQRRVEPELTVAVSQARPPAATPTAEHPDAPAAPLSYPAFEAEQGPSVLLRVYRPTDPENPDASESCPVPSAVGRSGKSYPGRNSTGGARTEDGWTLAHAVVYFPGAAEPLEKLVWELPGPKEREARLRFRLLDVPIPAADALPVQMWLPPERELPAEARGSRSGGGALRSQVRLHGAAAA